MNKRLSSLFLTTLLCAGLAQTPQAQTTGYFYLETNDTDLLLGLGIITAVGCGVAAACGAFSWSDQDIIKWAREGIEDTAAKYSQINNYSGPLIARLQLFGNRNAASWSFWDSELAAVAKEYPSLAPLHNALLNIQQDRKGLQKMHLSLVERNLTNHPACQRFYQELLGLMHHLDQLGDVILSNTEYTAEEQALHQKLHHMKKERAERERNRVLEEQARETRENNRIQRERDRERERERDREIRERIRRESEIAPAAAPAAPAAPRHRPWWD